jgi:hypothetical protein
MTAEPRNADDEEASNDIAPGTKLTTEDVEEGGDPSRTPQDEAASEAGFDSTPMQAKDAEVDDALPVWKTSALARMMEMRFTKGMTA